MLLVTGPNGKCNQTAEIKKNSTSKRNSPFYSAEQITRVSGTSLFSVRFLWRLASYYPGYGKPAYTCYYLDICSVLLSTACPTSLASDQTKGGGRPGVQRTPKFGAREQRFDLTKIQLSSKLSPKDPKEFAKKFRDATGEPREKRLLQITNLKATLQRLHRLYIYHTEKRSGRATPEIFLFYCYNHY